MSVMQINISKVPDINPATILKYNSSTKQFSRVFTNFKNTNFKNWTPLIAAFKCIKLKCGKFGRISRERFFT